MTNSCEITRFPNFIENPTLKPLSQPMKFRKCIVNMNHRYSHINQRTFWKCFNFERKITKFVKFFNSVCIINILTKLNVHIFHIFFLQILNRDFKEVFIKILLYFLKKCLETKKHNLLLFFNHRFSWNKITIKTFQAFWHHRLMTSLICVTF